MAFRTDIALNNETRQGVVKMLNADLADMHVLYTKLRNYHWNVVGPEFRSLHETFEEQYTAVALSIDEVAERIRALGGHAVGTMAEFLDLARLKEEERATYPHAGVMVQNALDAHEGIIRQLREDVDVIDNECGDAGTADFLTGLMEAHEKMAWMLRAFISGPGVVDNRDGQEAAKGGSHTAETGEMES